jgi:pimeloyl-ACP methyl ester carboxylesterase
MPSPVYQSEADLLSRFQLLPTKTCTAPVLLQHIARYSVCPREDGCLTLKFDRAALTREPRNLAALLPQITCPTLFVRGSESQNFSVSTFAEIVQRCPHARGVEIPGAGHHVFLDNPTAFLDIVDKFSKAVVEDHTCET